MPTVTLLGLEAYGIAGLFEGHRIDPAPWRDQNMVQVFIKKLEEELFRRRYRRLKDRMMGVNDSFRERSRRNWWTLRRPVPRSSTFDVESIYVLVNETGQ